MSLPIYHITHFKNLLSIIESGGLVAKSRQPNNRINYIDIAHQGIQDRRARICVPCAAGGMLHDYVPFYFAPRSPMLYSIHKGYVPGYQEGQSPILHLVVDAEVIESSGVPYTFTDGHAVMDYSDYFDDFSMLEQVIDWELMESRYWSDTDEDPNRKCKRQAEFLVYEQCPWNMINEIGVQNSRMRTQVEKLLRTYGQLTPVNVYSNWYY